MLSRRRKLFVSLGALCFYVASLVGVFVWGAAAHKFRVFPYAQVQRAYRWIMHDPPSTHWAIGIYTGEDVFNLTEAAGASNPVVQAADIRGVDAKFVADPFLVPRSDGYVMFFEVLNRKQYQGDIGFAESTDGLKWTYGGIVLDEGFHLSYPHVFAWDGSYYMIPESNQDLSVRLYRATAFPSEWEYLGNMLEGYHYTDPSIVRHDDRWYLFASVPGNDGLNLYHSDHLLTGWTRHPASPIVKGDKRIARCGGRVVESAGRLYRMAQDDADCYGRQVFALEILELSPTSYSERLVPEPIVGPSGDGWNATAMHHLDAHLVNGRWIAVADGRRE